MTVASCGGRQALLVVAIAFLVGPAPAFGDGGKLRQSTRTRGLDISVFTDPTPVKTGTVDVSVFVRPVPFGEARPLPAFQVCAYPIAAPAKRVCEPATAEVATNKLFRAAQLELSQPGLWQVEVVIDSADGSTVASFQLPVEEAYPGWVPYAIWIGLPAVAVVLFAVHWWLVRRGERAETAPGVVAPPAAQAPHGGS
jgi:hypothetical protein